MRTRRVLRVALACLLAAVLVATVVVAVLGLRSGDLKPLDLWASLIPVVLAVAAIVTTVLYSGLRPSGTLDEAVAAQVPALARSVVKAWAAESRNRGLFEDRRMAVRWRRRAGAERFSRLAGELPEEGVLNQLTGTFARRVRAGGLSRLVVTGNPGAGKTTVCVLTTLELAEPAGHLVPVIFQVSSWDPARPLMEWMTDELTAVYTASTDRTRNRLICAELVRHHVLPVLDGLDQAADRAAVLQGLAAGLEGRSFVLACRTEEFHALDADGMLRETLVVRLQPLRADEARGVLETARPGPVLEPLLAALEERPDGPLARVLETPFMLSLAVSLDGSLPREILSGGGANRNPNPNPNPNPNANAGGGAGADAEAEAEERIGQRLLGAFITQAYLRPRDKAPHYSAEDARRHLTFLARNVDPATGRLAWWQLHRAVPRWVHLTLALLNAAIGCSIPTVALFALFGRPLLGLWIGLGAALVGALVVELVPGDDPRRAKPRLRSVRPPSSHALQRVLGFGVVGGAACAVIVAFLYERPQYVVIGGVLSGITFAAARYFSEPSDLMEAITPTTLLRSDRSTVLYAWLAGAVAGGLTGAYLGGSIKAGRRTPQLDDVTLIDKLPTAVEALMGAAGGALLSATGLGLMALGSSSWGRFVATRGWLAVQGHTPRRLMAFMEDAQRREVLRQMNGHYEFRHQLLQRHLAEPARAVASTADTNTGPDNTQ
ncbi:NACHT domain-containing protein [Streptomyces sp. NPDC001002]